MYFSRPVLYLLPLRLCQCCHRPAKSHRLLVPVAGVFSALTPPLARRLMRTKAFREWASACNAIVFFQTHIMVKKKSVLYKKTWHMALCQPYLCCFKHVMSFKHIEHLISQTILPGPRSGTGFWNAVQTNCGCYTQPFNACHKKNNYEHLWTVLFGSIFFSSMENIVFKF